MSSSERLERIAEAIVFAHDVEVLPADGNGTTAELEQVAALATAALAIREPVPASLGARLAADGLAFCAERNVRAARIPPAGSSLRRIAIEDTKDVEQSTTAPNPFLPFLIGVAAVALVWFGVTFATGGGTAGTEPTTATRLAALERRPDARTLPWAAGPSPLAGRVQGKIVWSDNLQEGYMTFEGLPELTPDLRYQLWIVDGSRVANDPKSAPVDGGLFAITDAAARQVVPVQPHLRIGQAAAFVVTVEKAEGVVVSRQGDVVATAGL
ncbi:MAG: anti-sigma factor [Planctomycetes bacterium]|nr:anti-sigma factor [Planctomycetota bacterium]